MNMVTVCSKWPNPLHLDTLEYTSGQQANIKKRVTIRGLNNTESAKLSDFKVLPTHAETEVSEAHWNEWLAANSNNMLVVNQVVFAKAKAAEARAMAKELADEKTGFERLTAGDLPKGVTERKPNDTNDETFG